MQTLINYCHALHLHVVLSVFDLLMTLTFGMCHEKERCWGRISAIDQSLDFCDFVENPVQNFKVNL